MEYDNMSVKQITEAFDVDIRTVQRWQKKGAPHNRGKFNLPDLIKWRIEQERIAATPKGAEDGEKWLAEFRKQRAKIALLERLQKKGSLVPVAEAQKVLLEEVSAAKTALVAMPRKLAPRLYGKEPRDIEREIREEIDVVLNRLASRKVKVANETGASSAEAGDEERMEATGEDDGIRVGGSKPRATRSDKRRGRPVAKRKNAVPRRRDGSTKRSSR